MASRLIVLAAALVACQAVPIWFDGTGIIPGTVVFREGRSPDFAAPSIAYGFGSGVSSDIAGVRQSFGLSGAFQSGNGKAYGEGIGISDGNTFARGVGYANANPAPPVYRNTYPIVYAPYGLRRGYGDSYGAAVSSAQNVGGFGASIAQSQNTPYGSAATAVQNGGFQTAVSSAQNVRGLGYGSSLSSATSTGLGSAAASSADGYGTAISSTKSSDGNGFKSAISASQVGNGYRASTAQTYQQNGGAVQQSGATSINAPGLQASHSHSVNTGYY